MRILAAFDKCKDSLNADELCSLCRSRIEAKFPAATVREIPQTDGGEGFASILTRSREGRMRLVRGSDSLVVRMKSRSASSKFPPLVQA